MLMVLSEKQNHSNEFLTIGKVYDCYEKDSLNNSYYIITDDKGRKIAMSKYYFKSISEARDEKIDKILKK